MDKKERERTTHNKGEVQLRSGDPERDTYIRGIADVMKEHMHQRISTSLTLHERVAVYTYTDAREDEVITEDDMRIIDQYYAGFCIAIDEIEQETGYPTFYNGIALYKGSSDEEDHFQWENSVRFYLPMKTTETKARGVGTMRSMFRKLPRVIVTDS